MGSIVTAAFEGACHTQDSIWRLRAVQHRTRDTETALLVNSHSVSALQVVTHSDAMWAQPYQHPSASCLESGCGDAF